MIAIDLGSNTIRFIEYDGVQWGRSFEKIVKTAESLHATQIIGVGAVERIVAAVKEARMHLDFNGHECVGVTTAAMRLARNADDVLETLFNRCGIRFRVIDGEEEARLTLKAVRYRLQRLGVEPFRFLLSDIGGGSTELIESEGDTIRSISLNIGIVTLSESTEMEKRLLLFETDVRKFVLSEPETTLVLTAGTPTTIAAYVRGMDYEGYDPSRINGMILTLEDCLRVNRELDGMSESSRARYVGVGRERLISAGIRMVTSLYTALALEEAIVVDDGLREGVALAYYDEKCQLF